MYIYVYIYIYISSISSISNIDMFESSSSISGPETGERNRAARKADGKLTPLVNLVRPWHERRTLSATRFSSILRIMILTRILVDYI